MGQLRSLLKVIFQEKNRIALAALMGFVANISSVGLMATAAYLISQGALHPPLYSLTLVIVGVRFFGLARAASRYAERYFAHAATFSILGRLRVYFYQALEPLVPAVFNRYKSGDLLARIVGDVESLQYFFLRTVYPPVVMWLVFLATSIVMGFFSPKLAAILLGGLLVAGMMVPLGIIWHNKKFANNISFIKAELAHCVAEFVHGFIDIKINGQMVNKKNKIKHISRQILQEQYRSANLSGAAESILLTTSFLTAWLILVVSISLVEAEILPGVLLALVVLVGMTVFEAATPMATVPGQLAEQKIAADRLYSLIESSPIIPNVEKKPVQPLCTTVQFKEVSFSYPEETELALSQVSFQLTAGKKIAVVGASGSGKSSIINLLVKFYDWQQGDIYLGGINLREYSGEDVRKYMGVVSQENHFFNDTLRSNLLLANKKATDQQLRHVLAQVSLSHLDLDSIIGERGLALSGGERQRAAFARILLKDAPIVLLDEPTANLDPVTAREVESVLWPLLQDKAVLNITHDLTRLENMDEIIVMAKGTIVERGSLDQLLQRKTYFYKLWQLQRETLGGIM